MRKVDTVVLDVYEILDQLGISREAVQFFTDQEDPESEEAVIAESVPTE